MVNSKSGFTLIEVVLASAVISIIGVLSSSLIITIFKSYNRSNSTSQINRVGQTLTSIFEAQIRNATSVYRESDEEIRYTITDDSGDDIHYSLKYVSKDCIADNRNSFISISSLSGASYPESPVTPTNINTGVNVASVTLSDNLGVIDFEFTLEQACNLPTAKSEFVVSKTYNTKVVPRFNYGN